MQFSRLPTAPHHCRFTPGVLDPFLTSLVSSMSPIACAPACRVRTISWSRSHILSSDQRSWVKNSCKVRGGTPAFRVGTNGSAFGVADNTTMTVMDLLLAVDAQTVNGVLYTGNTANRTKANNVFGAINQAGRI